MKVEGNKLILIARPNEANATSNRKWDYIAYIGDEETV